MQKSIRLDSFDDRPIKITLRYLSKVIQFLLFEPYLKWHTAYSDKLVATEDGRSKAAIHWLLCPLW